MIFSFEFCKLLYHLCKTEQCFNTSLQVLIFINKYICIDALLASASVRSWSHTNMHTGSH